MSTSEHNKRVDYIEFPTTDIIGTKRFFSEVFGWVFEDYGPDYISFNDGRLTGGFFRSDEAGTNKPLVVIYADDLEALQSQVFDAGGTIAKEIFSFPGGRRFHFMEPGGNELAVWSEK